MQILLLCFKHQTFFLCLKHGTGVSACSSSSERLFTPLLVSLNQTLQALNSLQLCLEKRLNKVFQETTVDFLISCQIPFLRNIRYLSYNLVTTSKKGNLTYPLSDCDRFKSCENFTQDREMEVSEWRSWKRLHLSLLPCNSHGPPRTQIWQPQFMMLLLSLRRMTVSSLGRRRKFQIGRV